MIENIADLTETVQRYKIYVRHLIGVEINEDKTIDKTGTFLIVSSISLLNDTFFCFSGENSVWNVWENGQ